MLYRRHNGLRGGRERFLSYFIFASCNRGIHTPLLHLLTRRGSGKKKNTRTLPLCTKQKTGAFALFTLKTREGFFLFCFFVVGFSLTGLQVFEQISERTIRQNESAFVTLAGRPLMIQSGVLASA